MARDDLLSHIEEHFHVLPLGEKSLDLGKIISTDTSVKILESVYNSDNKVGVSASEISEALGVGRTTVIYHLGRMLESGLIEMNSILRSDDSWKKFWDLYRSRNVDITKEQFNKIHNSRMNGVKLFVPTKKGFLFLPAVDAKESRSMVRDVLTSITTLAIEGDYKRLKKTSSLIGTIGAVLIALSFLIQTPFIQSGSGPLQTLYFAQEAPAIESAASPADNPMALSASGPPPPPEPREGKTLAESQAVPSAEKTDLGVEEGFDLAVGELEAVGKKPEDTFVRTEKESKINDDISKREAPLTLIAASPPPRMSLYSKALLYLGIMLVGSFLGFLILSSYRKK
jgi:DNA-binding transcriptional ArsR family regulator